LDSAGFISLRLPSAPKVTGEFIRRNRVKPEVLSPLQKQQECEFKELSSHFLLKQFFYYVLHLCIIFSET
jgi:hypothetical protein